MKPRPGGLVSKHCKLGDDALVDLVKDGDAFAAAELQRRHGWATIEEATWDMLGDTVQPKSLAAIAVGLRPYLLDHRGT